MNNQLTKNATRNLSCVIILILCLALLAGCSVAPSNSTADALVDEDMSASLDSSTPAETVSPERALDVAAEPLESALPPVGFAIM